METSQVLSAYALRVRVVASKSHCYGTGLAVLLLLRPLPCPCHSSETSAVLALLRPLPCPCHSSKSSAVIVDQPKSDLLEIIPGSQATSPYLSSKLSLLFVAELPRHGKPNASLLPRRLRRQLSSLLLRRLQRRLLTWVVVAEDLKAFAQVFKVEQEQCRQRLTGSRSRFQRQLSLSVRI